ncbi:HDOD domain-containing protein [Marinobacter sp.]|uniref:HDOD domain-containing protein n=1 Tax=Marinobacter sp. TaxID=50741 RepID=UPI002B268D32|nr:HDOD domain-containing protein [Marinobacter sp.]
MFSKKQPEQSAQETRLFSHTLDEQANTENATAEPPPRLEEHLFCWLLDAQPAHLKKHVPSADKVLAELGQRLQSNAMEELPRKPGTLPMLMRALSAETTDRKHLTDIILSDPSLTDQLLQVANSPQFKPGDHVIESVDQAVFVLGLNGIKNVIAAAVMRPMIAARNSSEALFAQRAWRWGLTCARSAEMIARIHNDDTSAHFMVGLLPSLAYITIRREITAICRTHNIDSEPEPALLKQALAQYQWATCQLLANIWALPPKYHAWLLTAERPSPTQENWPLLDGLVVGTREVLRHARQRNLAEDELQNIVHISPQQLDQVRAAVLTMLKEGGTEH